MAKGFKHGASGGGSGGLNFEVIAYATEEELTAATPKKNVVGVITTDKITSWAFIVTEPEAPEEGMVWFTTATTSAVSFNALKKNGVYVYPIYAKQYVGGAWVDKVAKSYQGGAWVDWLSENDIYKNGVINTYVIGGFSGFGSTVVENTGEFLRVYNINSSESNANLRMASDKPINVTNLTTISVLCQTTFQTSNASAYKVGVSKTRDGNLVASASITNNSPGTSNISVSGLGGEYYIIVTIGYTETPKTKYTKITKITTK